MIWIGCIKFIHVLPISNKTKRLIDAITSNNGYRWKISLMILTDWLPYPKSRDAIASKNDSRPDQITVSKSPAVWYQEDVIKVLRRHKGTTNYKSTFIIQLKIGLICIGYITTKLSFICPISFRIYIYLLRAGFGWFIL